MRLGSDWGRNQSLMCSECGTTDLYTWSVYQ